MLNIVTFDGARPGKWRTPGTETEPQTLHLHLAITYKNGRPLSYEGTWITGKNILYEV